MKHSFFLMAISLILFSSASYSQNHYLLELRDGNIAVAVIIDESGQRDVVEFHLSGVAYVGKRFWRQYRNTQLVSWYELVIIEDDGHTTIKDLPHRYTKNKTLTLDELNTRQTKKTYKGMFKDFEFIAQNTKFKGLYDAAQTGFINHFSLIFQLWQSRL